MDSFPLFPSSLRLSRELLASHHIYAVGTTGSGKTGLLKSIFLQLLELGIGATFVDPHGDASLEILNLLHHQGFFADERSLEKLLYFEFDENEDGYFLPLNLLNRPDLPPHLIAADVIEAMHRAWPALDGGAAPAFDTFLSQAIPALIATGQPLPALKRFLTEERYRNHLLEKVSDPEIVSFWRHNFDRLRGNEAVNQVQSVIRRIVLLTANPALRYSLGQTENVFSPRVLMDKPCWALLNLSGIQDREARRLLGCLLLTSYERDTLARKDRPREERQTHLLIVDEFGQFAHTSEDALNNLLSEARKYQVFLVMAHQTLSQTSRRLQGALQNAKIRVSLKVGREDAEVLARQLGAVDPYQIKAEAKTEVSQPLFLELQAQWELWIQNLMDLKPRQAYVKVADQPTRLIRTADVANPPIDHAALAELRTRYRRRLMKHRNEVALTYLEEDPSSLTRTVAISSDY